MAGSALGVFSFWWIVPVVMMILCLFMMRGRRGRMMSGFGCCGQDRQRTGGAPSAKDILDRRYASGEIDTEEYEAKRRTVSGSTAAITHRTPSNGGTAK